MPTPTERSTPPSDFALDRALVEQLLADQHKDLAALTVREVESGWDNQMFRLGERLAARLPRRVSAADLIQREQEWLPRFAGRLGLPIPAPVRVGRPGRGYPCRWSVVPWLEGRPVGEEGLPAAEAPRFGAFLRSLHQPAPADAPGNPYRGVPLARRAGDVEARMRRLVEVTELITEDLRRIWTAALEAPSSGGSTWIHGDLHPGNVLAEGGRITGVIDWGDLTAGDPATDLASAWLLFDDASSREALFEGYPGLDEAMAARARGWAVFFGVVLLDAGLADNSSHAVVGERIVRRLVR
jgi:aminoglycoside phosphotransferase (APT) family kinase protein